MRALQGIRVLDLTDESGAYAAKLFADLGADVVRIVPVEGDPLTRSGPYLPSPHAEASLPYQFFNTNKRSMRLDLDHPAGRSIFKQLVAEADALIETFPPGWLERRDLGYDQLSQLRPQLVHTAITPFGQKGPYSQYAATDLTVLALGGLLYLAGYPDTEPIALCANQAYYAASLYGAVGTMLALLDAEETGTGQYVDLSMQEAVAMALENAAQYYDMEGVIRRRQGAYSPEAGMGLFPCQDGYVLMVASGLGERSWQALLQWMEESGCCDMRPLQSDEWNDPAYRRTEEAKRRFFEVFTQFSSGYPKEVLYEEGQARRIPICPVNAPEDIANNRQLKARDFFHMLYHPFLGQKIIYPGAPYRLSETPWSLRQPAPPAGYHSAEILAQLGYSEQEIIILRQQGVI